LSTDLTSALTISLLCGFVSLTWVSLCSQFPRYEDGDGANVTEVPVPMVALVATAVSASILFRTSFWFQSAVCCNLRVAYRATSSEGLHCQYIYGCISGPYRHV
jgi:hypothetical protein